jgi:hypothetical protein
MSAAGISVFYGAMDEETACAETCRQETEAVSVGAFESTRELCALDLTKLPPVPGFYSDVDAHTRDSISFLHAFVAEVTQPTERDGREDVEYAPTQIVAEYFRWRFRLYGPGSTRPRLDGILYPSAQGDGGVNIVLFIERDNFEGVEDGSLRPDKILRLKSSKTRTFKS